MTKSIRASVNNDTAFADRRLGDTLRDEAARPGTDPDLVGKLLEAAAKADALDGELLATLEATGRTADCINRALGKPRR